MGYEPATHTASNEVALSFVIPVRNDAEGLARCLESIRQAAAAALAVVECIVVDNGSTDGSGNAARAAGCRVLVVPHERVGALRNRGAEMAAGSLLGFVDADHEISPGWIAAAVSAMSDPAVAAAGAPCHPPATANWVQAAYNGMRDHVPGPRAVEWLGSGNMVVRAGVFRRIGGFDAALEACEDVDLCRRIRHAGGLIVSDPRLGNIHHGDPSSLAAIFRGELWRGRNNLRVSLRERPSLRSLPSIAIPVAQLTAIVWIVVAALAAKPAAAFIGLGALPLPSLARAGRMWIRARVPFSHAAAVAVVYDLARALALLMRAKHRRAETPAWMPSP